MKRTLIYIVACAVTAISAAAQQQMRFSLDDCVSYAMSDNLTRRSMELSHRSAQLDAQQARLERLPSLSASASGSLNHQNGERRTTSASYGASAGMTIWQGGALNQSIKQSDLQQGQAATRVAQWDNTLAINIMTSYFAIKGYEELRRYQGALIAASQEQVRDGRARFEAGAMIESDFLMLEAQLAQNQNQMQETELNFDNEMRNLKALMSMKDDTALALDDPAEQSPQLPAQADFIAAAEQVSPDLELLRYGVNIAKTGLKISRAAYAPTLSASGGVNTGHSGRYDIGSQLRDRLSQSAGLSLSVPIFNRGRTRLSVEKSKISLQQAELERQQGELDVRQSLLRSYSDAVSARNGAATSAVRERAYGSSLSAARAQYAAGTIKPVDLLQQENNYVNVMYEYVQEKYSLLLRERILRIYMGQR